MKRPAEEGGEEEQLKMGQIISKVVNPSKRAKHVQMSQQCLDASLVRIQNLLILARDLNLHVQYRVMEMNGSRDEHRDRDLIVIVKVLHDRVFPQYREHSSSSDLPLFRGLFLKVTASGDLKKIKLATVQQAFLPKFENEGQDSEIADIICNAADTNFMVITIKHSGSLVTLSPAIAGAKNSVDNDFAHSGMILLSQHYRRIAGNKWKAKIDKLMDALVQQNIALSFEAVTGCLGHHGQIPNGEHLVTTSAHTIDDTGAVKFLPWLQFMQFCTTYQLPINDSWLVGSTATANRLRDLLDKVTETGTPTDVVLQKINENVYGQQNCIHVRGTYPHAEWQGSRMEGFVISQGQPVTQELVQELKTLAIAASKQVINFDSNDSGLNPVSNLMQKYKLQQDSNANCKLGCDKISEFLTPSMPTPVISPVDNKDGNSVINMLINTTIPTQNCAVVAEDGTQIFSRLALKNASKENILEKLKQVQLQNGLINELQNGKKMEGGVMNSVMKALSGGADTNWGGNLRYKKKIKGWNDKYVGYCMMTFIIRNGIKTLKADVNNYLTYVKTLANKWGESPDQQLKYVQFASAWAQWAEDHVPGGTKGLNEDTYLDYAEPFVKDFLAGTCRGTTRPKNAFQGIILLLNFPKQAQNELKLKLNAHFAPPANDLKFSRNLVEGGCVVWFDLGGDDKQSSKNLTKEFWTKGQQYTYIIWRDFAKSFKEIEVEQQALTSNEADKESTQVIAKQQEITKRRNKLLGSYNKMQKFLQNLQNHPEHILELKETDEINFDESIVPWLGAGTAFPPQDPSFVVTFVCIPGMGKSVVCEKLFGGGGGAPEWMEYGVYSSDEMRAKKKMVKGFWEKVAESSVSYRGGESRRVVLADKNLTDMPRGNLQKVSDIIHAQEAQSVAVLLESEFGTDYTRGDNIPEWAYGLPVLPFSMEYIALSMSRVISRRNHIGGLDHNLRNVMKVCCGFAAGFKNISKEDLLEKLKSKFTHVIKMNVCKSAPADFKLPEEVYAHLAEGLKTVQKDASNDLSEEWNDKARRLFNDQSVREILDTLSADLESNVKLLEDQLLQIVQKPSSQVQQKTASLQPKYIAVSGFEESGLMDIVKQKLGSEYQDGIRSGLHITLWHKLEDPEGQTLPQLMALLGDVVPFEVTHLDHSPEVSALRVRIMCDLPSEVQSTYFHITMRVAQGSVPADAKKLPAKIAAGEAAEIALDQSVQLEGQIMAFSNQ